VAKIIAYFFSLLGSTLLRYFSALAEQKSGSTRLNYFTAQLLRLRLRLTGLCNILTGDVLHLAEPKQRLLVEWESWSMRLLLQPSVSGVAVFLLVLGLTVDILWCFHGLVC